MKKILNSWVIGVENLFLSFGVSLYAYIPIVVVGLISIWASGTQFAMLFTILAIVNILTIGICGFLKRQYLFSKVEVVISSIYLVVIVGIFIFGCTIDFKWSIYTILFPNLISGLNVLLRNLQANIYAKSKFKILQIMNKLFDNSIVYLVSYLVVLVGPFAIFFYHAYFAISSQIWVILISFVFLLLLPLIVWFESNIIGETIFGIAFNVNWSKEVEESVKNLNDLFDTLNKEDFIKVAEKFDKEFNEDPNRAVQLFIEELQRLQNESKK